MRSARRLRSTSVASEAAKPVVVTTSIGETPAAASQNVQAIDEQVVVQSWNVSQDVI